MIFDFRVRSESSLSKEHITLVTRPICNHRVLNGENDTTSQVPGGCDRGRMGNESSVPVRDDTVPQTLESRTLEGVAKYIKEKKASKIVVMVRKSQNMVVAELMISSDRPGHQYICWDSRLSFSQYRTVCQPCTPKPTVR